MRAFVPRLRLPLVAALLAGAALASVSLDGVLPRALAQGGGGSKKPPATPGDEEATKAAELKELLRKINGKAAQERIAAAGGLGSLGKGAPKEAVNSLTNHLSDSDPRVRAACAEALGRVDDGTPRVVAALGAALAQKAPVKAAAASGLSGLGEKARSAMPQLIKALPESTEPIERRNILRAFGTIGTTDAKQKKSMIEGAHGELGKSDDRDVKLAAAIALVRLGEQDPATVPVLAEAATAAKTDLLSRREAVDALAGLGATAEPAVPQLTAIVKEAFVENAALPYQEEEKKQHAAMRAAAARALGGLGKAAKPALSALDAAAAANSDPDVTTAAKEAAEKIRATG